MAKKPDCKPNPPDFGPLMKRFDALDAAIKNIQTKEDKLMALIDDLNAAIAAEDVEIQDIQASIVKIAADITALLAKISAGGATPEQIQTVLTAAQSHLASLTTAAQQLKDADTAANPPA